LRSFILVCQELDIPNIEYQNIPNKQVGKITVQQWADYSVEQFLEEYNKLSRVEKMILVESLIICEEILGVYS